MDKDSSSINNYNHSISLLERKTLVITGVKKIENFDKQHFLLETTMGVLMIKGEELELIKLDTLAGNVTIKGMIGSMNYAQENAKHHEESLLSRLFKYWILKYNFLVCFFLFFLVVPFFFSFYSCVL